MENNIQENITGFVPDAPTLSSSSMLVKFQVSMATFRKLDKRASLEVAERAKADPNVANVHKQLLGDCKELDAVKKFVGNTRNVHYAMTLPWSRGIDLLPTKTFFKYKKQMSGLEQEFFKLLEKFYVAYEDAVVQAQTTLGDLYHPDNYPPLDIVKGKFSWGLNFLPLPTGGDFRLDIEKEQADVLREEYDKHYKSVFGDAVGSMMEKLKDYLTNASYRLDYQDHEDKRKFNDTLVSNVTDLIDDLLIPLADQDDRLKELSRELSDTFQGISPDALRADGVLRRNTKKSVDDVINSIKSLGW